MNIDQCYPSKYLKSDDLDEDVTYTIRKVEIENLSQGKDKDEKPIVYFEEVEKGIVLNVTNKNTIKGMYGPDTDGWVGKQVTLFATEVEFKGEMTMAIRIRLRKPEQEQHQNRAGATSGNSGAMVGANAAGVAKQEAWKAFCVTHKALPGDIVTKQWIQAVKEYFDGKAPSQLSADDWLKFIADDFKKILDLPPDGTFDVAAGLEEPPF